ncbi:MAG: ATP-binding cassette domain-containing protein [Chloroflexi bacterium]|nr:ATP-binding cassette domain-containing protein [Chloroflexota bacterium]
MPIIQVAHLTKTFQLKVKPAGLRGSLAALTRPQYRPVEAVRGLSFEIDEGELVAFIGPNGAGKSTTLKMLTGLLYPTSGEAHVLGLAPWNERGQLAFRIGSVFGQKSQLWYHLPPSDTFDLFAKIYELDERAYRSRRAQLIETFAIREFLDTPVRRLSLGERMRCEIVASLLHRPTVIFLDEPTIGLDVVSKQQIRATLKQLNADERVTIILTSHDATDVESICKRVVIINHGQVIYDDRVSRLKRQHLTRKTIDVRFAGELTVPFALAGAQVVKQSQYGVKLEFDSRERSVEEIIQRILASGDVEDINIAGPSMEEIIREIYSAAESPATDQANR